MRAASRSNPSLWWRLSWQLSVVIVGVIAVVIVGLSFWATTVMSPNIAMEEEIGEAVAQAAARGPDGRFELRETPQFRSLKQRYDRLWYVATTTDGASVSYGTIPPAYAALASLVHLFDDADIRGSTATTEIASIDDIETDIGEIRILLGGVADKGSPVLALLRDSYPIYASLLVIALPAIFLAVPRIVGRALARVSDVARKASEIEPRRHSARLPAEGIPKEIAPLVTAFNGALERLEDQYKKRQRFLIDAAHELRTPIAIMQTRIDGMPEGRERTRLLHDVARLGETAEQLLDFERSDQTTDLHETVDLVEIARSVVADLAPLAIAAGYQISFESDTQRLERKGSLTALRRAVSNLVRNAIDHGGNTGAIAVLVSAQGGIQVVDEGPGIPAGHRELVFEPFYRVAPKSQGAGLGLSLVKQIVASHKGRVSISNCSTGTAVTIQL